MKILHLCLACFYIDNYTYQENILPRINHEDGHDVRILASTETYVDNAHLGYVEPAEYVTEYGVPIKRLPYVKAGNGFVTHKFRAYPHLYEEIAAFAPDVILSHDLSYWSVLDVIRYKKAHPAVKLYADTHTAYNNSGTNWLSLHILHRGLYRYLTKKAFPYLEKYFYISDECREFSHEVYDIPNEKMEFYSIGTAKPCLLLRKDHPLAALPMVSLQELSPYPLVSYDYGVDGSVYVSEEGVTMLQTDRQVAVSDGLMLTNVLVSTDTCAVAMPYLGALLENCGIVFRPILGVKPLHLGWIKKTDRVLQPLAKQYLQMLRTSRD